MVCTVFDNLQVNRVIIINRIVYICDALCPVQYYVSNLFYITGMDFKWLQSSFIIIQIFIQSAASSVVHRIVIACCHLSRVLWNYFNILLTDTFPVNNNFIQLVPFKWIRIFIWKFKDVLKSF